VHRYPGFKRNILITCAVLASLAISTCSWKANENGEAAWAASALTMTPAEPPVLSVTVPPSGTLPGGDTQTSPVSASSTPTINITSIEIRPPVQDATPQECNGRVGRFEQMLLTATYLPLPMEVLIYLPPCYDKQLSTRFPVLYLIHGQGFREDQWDRLGADETADMLIRTRQVTSFIIVMPHDAFLRDPQESPFRRAFIEILVPWVEKNYRTLNDREHRAIGGLSRGGAWAFYLGLSHHEMFSAIGMHSSFFFNGQEYPTRTLLQSIPPEEMPRLFIDIGGEDHLIQANRQLEKLLMIENVPYEWYLFPGRHEEFYWSSHMEQYLRWYAREW
jgi:enterochelin esterase-like enzyme